MIIEKHNVIQTLNLSKIHLGGPKMSKYKKKFSALFNDAPLNGLYPLSALARDLGLNLLSVLLGNNNTFTQYEILFQS